MQSVARLACTGNARECHPAYLEKRHTDQCNDGISLTKGTFTPLAYSVITAAATRRGSSGYIHSLKAVAFGIATVAPSSSLVISTYSNPYRHSFVGYETRCLIQ